jgi:cell wall-associated NlpC family hydrolase
MARRSLAAALLLASAAVSVAAAAPAAEPDLSAYAESAGEWASPLEAAIERAYRECFRTFFIDGRLRTLRLPFAENSERSELAGAELKVEGGGKGAPGALWESIDRLLGSDDFASYLRALSDGREKVIYFDLPTRSWSASEDRFAVERMLKGIYAGLPHRPAVLSRALGAEDADIYNYVYCVGGLGIDCSGFVWHVLRAVGKEGGFDLDAARRREAKLPRKVDPSLFVGAQYFDPRNGRTRELSGRIDALLPGDILLFRGEDGLFIHSCVIQSVDFAAGKIRYLQSTDESPLYERGVHDSTILFDPSAPGAKLKDPGLGWTQLRGAAFEGEPPPAFVDDGGRFRAYAELGGGAVVRLKALEKTVAKLRARAPKSATASPAAKPQSK